MSSSFAFCPIAKFSSTNFSTDSLASCSSPGLRSSPFPLQWCAQRISTRFRILKCTASSKERVDSARKLQRSKTDLLAQLIKAENTVEFAKEHVESLDQEFFMIASTYLSMAKKEGNAEVVNRIETILKTAMQEREKILRPEIQLLNQLLRDKGTSDRKRTMDQFQEYLTSDSYFFQLLNRMTLDVENQRKDVEQMKLLAQLRTIGKEAKEVSRALKQAAKKSSPA
ncbi:hypothetical protein KP509_32G002800 [Ceratopteris richardii]|uniref:Uncharacterized protein n=1 Tax=Ceratopteris richardii TaxID=49495 RepID=A0A8T2QRY3_CERRI|nr:hypothetical protein KP509_32G002800 [Ceratopteris richardii]